MTRRMTRRLTPGSMHLRLAATLVTAALLAAGGAQAQIRPAPVPGFRPARPVETDVEAGIIDRTNAFRTEHGLSALTESAALTTEARAFAAYLARTGVMSHTADGRSSGDRASAAGYDYCEVTENLAFEEDARDFRGHDVAADLMHGWENSPDHRRNLLEPDVVEIGVGVARAPTHTPKYLAVQVFGRPASLRFLFRVTNRTTLQIRYSYEGRTQSIEPGVTITYRPCAPGLVAFEAAGPAGRAPYVVEPDALYVLVPDERGGVRVEIKRRDT